MPNCDPIYRAEIPWQDAVSLLRYLDKWDVTYDCYAENAAWITASMKARVHEYVRDPIYLSMIQRLREILDEIRQQFQRLETAGRQNQILLIREYVDAHITDPALTVGSLSEQFRVAPSHLTAQFQRYFGMTLYKYIQRERLNHCRALLENAPSMTVEELAAASGYTDLSTMYRAFKRYEGTTPGALRTGYIRGK